MDRPLVLPFQTERRLEVREVLQGDSLGPYIRDVRTCPIPLP